MGTPIPPPVEPPAAGSGSACTFCWGSGKAFGNVDTPDKIIISLWGINKASGWVPGDGEPINGDFECDQVPGFPCTWQFQLGGVSVTFAFGSGLTRVIASNPEGHPTFDGTVAQACILEMPNDLTVEFTGGTAVILLGEI